ncbi:MAG: hypothetical protein FWD98_06175 [Defluviitaleaceae bacterium]|nr:hypothetical protein [Defluviitaleaceae bacterium]
MNKLLMNKGFRIVMMVLLAIALVVVQLVPRYPSFAHATWGTLFTIILAVHILSNHKWISHMSGKFKSMTAPQQEKYFTMAVMLVAYILVIVTAVPALNNILITWYGETVDVFYRLALGVGIPPHYLEYYIPAYDRATVDRNMGNFHRWVAGVATGATLIHIYQGRAKIKYFLASKKPAPAQPPTQPTTE